LKLGAVLFAALDALPSVAHAQNADSFYYSNEAALTAGAMVAVQGDDGAAWYNPAGLGGLHRTRLNANGSVFGFRVRRIDGGLTSSLRGVSSSVDYGGTDFVSTPTTASASFELLPNLTLSGGMFHSQHDVRAAVGVGRASSVDGTARLSQKIDTLNQQRKLHAGGAYGFDLGHGFRLGGAMFLVYSVRDSSVDYLVGLDDGGPKPEVLALSVNTGTSAFGLQSTNGLQWDASKRLHFGVLFRMPEFGFRASGRAALTSIASEAEETAFGITDQKAASNRFRWRDPARLVFGVACEASDKLRLALDVDMTFPLEEDTWGARHDTTAHARAGVLLKPLDAVHFGLGAFVDPASERELAPGLGSLRANYYGGTAGVIFRTRLTHDSGPDAPVITLSTAIRYAVGFGDARTAAISDDTAGTGTRAITVHDIMPYLGSSVGF
jgi:hypothetical protein